MGNASPTPAESVSPPGEPAAVEVIEADIPEDTMSEAVDPPPPDNPTFPFDPAKQKADTARKIAYALVSILGGSILLHYVAVFFTSYQCDSALRLEAYKAAFNAWLPVASGLVSAAVTYYLTRDRDDKK